MNIKWHSTPNPSVFTGTSGRKGYIAIIFSKALGDVKIRGQ